MKVYNAVGDSAYIVCRTQEQVSKEHYEQHLDSLVEEQPCHIKRQRSPSMGPERYTYHHCPHRDRIKVIWGNGLAQGVKGVQNHLDRELGRVPALVYEDEFPQEGGV